MHESGALSWRDVVDRHHSGLVDELSVVFDSELRGAASRAAADERAQASAQTLSQIESLNQVLRRLRSAGEEQILQLLAEGCAAYADKLVVLVFENSQGVPGNTEGRSGTQARSAAAAGTGGDSVRFDIALAPAITAAIQSQDPFVALATDGEISPELAAALGTDAGGRRPGRRIFSRLLCVIRLWRCLQPPKGSALRKSSYCAGPPA